ncbi:MAG: helix-turn-helix domain-containing protein, partial [Patescibacteria group bacterium]
MQYKHLSIEEREFIQRELWTNSSIPDIAKSLNRSPGSISRELQRNSSPEKHFYNSRLAHNRALKKRH